MDMGRNRNRWIVILSLLILTWIAFSHKSSQKSLSIGGIRSNAERIAWLMKNGWEVEDLAESQEELRLPKELPPILKAYNELQKKQGFDLCGYLGKRVNVYTYRIKNAPEGETLYCTLYQYRHRIIGGDVHSASLDGAMQGILREKLG